MIATSATPVLTGYAAGDIASASLALSIGGPLSGAFVALQFRGFARFARTLQSPRPGTVAVLGTWWVLLLGAPTCVCLAVVVTAGTVPDDTSSWALLAMDFLTVMACALVGLGFAWALPVVIAVPTAAMLLFLWFTYTASDGNALLHNMNASFPACCASVTQPATGALLAALTLAGLVCSGIALLLAPRRWAGMSRLVLAPAVAGVLLLGFGVGAAVAAAATDKVTIQAVEPRTTTLACKSQENLRICLWPENRERVPELAGIAGDLNTVLERWGLQTIDGFTQGARERGAVSVEASDHLTHDDLRYSVAAGYVDLLAGCRGAYGRWSDERVGLIGLAAGVDISTLRGRIDPRTADRAEQQFARARTAPAAVRSWFLAEREAARCGPQR